MILKKNPTLKRSTNNSSKNSIVKKSSKISIDELNDMHKKL